MAPMLLFLGVPEAFVDQRQAELRRGGRERERVGAGLWREGPFGEGAVRGAGGGLGEGGVR